MIEDLISLLKSKNLNLEVLELNAKAALMAFDVWAKPGSKVERSFISLDGVLIVQTRAKPVDGAANAGIIESVAMIFGVSKSSVEIIRGEKSRNKRVKLVMEFTANKKEAYYSKKISEIEVQVALS